jgi:hypothetical protein
MDLTNEKHKVFSRLIDFLEKNDLKIHWSRTCFREGRYYQGYELEGHLDNEFSSTTYYANLQMSEIHLEFCVTGWKSNPLPYFSLRFTKWAVLDLNPKPTKIGLFYNNPHIEEKESAGEMPIYQARYNTLFVLHFEEAKTAMQDFVERGEELSEYFRGLQDISQEQYLRLLEKFKRFQDYECIVRV